MAINAYIDETGIHVPTYPDVLADLIAEFRAIYGEDTYLEPDSQDGQMIAAFALRIFDCYTLAASVYNAYSPQTAQGTGLSSVVKINGIRRDVASFSTVDLLLTGQAGATIYNGAATDDAGNRWLLPAEVVIPVSGEALATATAAEAGVVRAAPGEIINIATPTRGWQAVTNPSSAVTGAPVETDAVLRTRQRVSTALPSLSVFDGLMGAVASLPDVTRWRGYENDTSLTDADGIPPHCICVVVEGGDTTAIATAIATKKTPGTGTYGATSTVVRDVYGVPNTINFARPVIVDVEVTLEIRPLRGYLAATGEVIRTNLVSYINSLDIGDDVLLSKLYTPINAAEPVEGQRTFDVLSLAIGPEGGPVVPANLILAFTSAPASSLDLISLTVTP